MHDHEESGCEGCSLNPGRRAFLRDSMMAAFGVLLAVGRVDALASRGTTVTYPLPVVDGAQIDRAQEIILVRWQGDVFAFALSCPHRRTALRWIESDSRFQCPKHKSKYRPDGVFMSGRATRGMDRFDVQRVGDTIVVDTRVLHKQDRDEAGWSAAFVKVEE